MSVVCKSGIKLGESKNESLGGKGDLSIEIPSDAHIEKLKKIVEDFDLKAQRGG